MSTLNVSITLVQLWFDFSLFAAGSQCVKVKTHLFGAQLNLYWNETFWWTQTKITLLNRLVRALFSFFFPPFLSCCFIFVFVVFHRVAVSVSVNERCVYGRFTKHECTRCSGVYAMFTRLLSSQIRHQKYLHPVKVFVFLFVFQCVPFRWSRRIVNMWRHDKNNTITYFVANLSKQNVVSGQKATSKKITYAACWVEVLGQSEWHEK